jgi:hypothetical protein
MAYDPLTGKYTAPASTKNSYLDALNASIANIEKTTAAANRLAATPTSNFTYNAGNPLAATTPAPKPTAPAGVSKQFQDVLSGLAKTTERLTTAEALGRAATAGPVVSAADTAQVARDRQVAESAAKQAATLSAPGGQLPPQPGAAWIWNGSSWVRPAMPQDGGTYTWDNNRGWVAQDINTATSTASRIDSIAAIKALLSSYGIGDLGDAITNAVTKGYSNDTIQLIMQDPNSNDPLAVAFQQRFPANKARLAAGKSVLSPSEYLRAERSYTEVLQSYGVSNLASREKLNQFITNDISAAEVADRVGLAINRVQNADPDTKKALAEFYPMLNQSDIVGAVLDPAEGLPALQRKIQIAEIGGASLAAGIKTSEGKTKIAMGAEALANLGVTKEQARQGFQTVAEITPRAEFLSQISTGEDYGQLQAEQEAFQGLASAKRARTNLTEQERARFGGSAGVNKSSLTQQTRGAF